MYKFRRLIFKYVIGAVYLMLFWLFEKVFFELFGKGINLDIGGDWNINYYLNVILGLEKVIC